MTVRNPTCVALHKIQLLICWLAILFFNPIVQAKTNQVPADYDAALQSFTAPAAVVTGQVFSVEVILKNTGRLTWNEHFRPIWLGSENAMSWRDVARVSTKSPPSPHVVAPGESAHFVVDCTAPAMPGVYPFCWRMVAENVAWFGDVAQKIIVVVKDPARLKPAERIWNYDFRMWQAEDGLPHNIVHALWQSSDGYIWLGTQAGLARFDGIRFKTFESEAPQAVSTSISALTESTDGSLWIGTSDAGLVRLQRGTWSVFATENGLVNNAIRTLFFDTSGVLWIGTTNGLSRFQEGKFQNLTATDGLPASPIRAFADDRKGGVWVGSTGDGICRIQDGKIVEALREKLPTLSIRGLLVDREEKLWVAGFGAVFHISPDRTVVFGQSEGLPHDITTTIREDRMGNFWIGSYGGIVRLSGGKWIIESDPHGVSLDSVSSIIEDREGNIWCGSKDGLVRFKPQHFFTYTQRQGLTHNNVMSVCADRAGAMWIGTWGGGVNRLVNDKITAYSQRDGLSLNMILGLQIDRENRVWVGTDFVGGLNCWSNNIFQNWKLPDSSVRVITEARDGTFWIGTGHSLIHWNNEVLGRFTKADGLAGNTIRTICEDNDGAIWIGTNEGLSRRKNGAFSNFTKADGLPPTTILALHLDTANTLWIGTGGVGLCRRQDNQFQTCTTKDGLYCDDISAIVEDDRRRFWIASPKGIFSVEKDEVAAFFSGRTKRIRCKAFGKSDGLQSIQCNSVAQPSAWKSNDGRLWFATTKGLAVVDPMEVETSEATPAVFIEEVIADKKNVTNGEWHLTRTAADPVTLPPGRGELEFHYTAIAFSETEKTRFRYRLEGADADWVDAGTRRVAYYNNLSPGTYTFQVIACNSDGVWNSLGANVKLSLLPHFWQTWWFRGFCGLAVLGVVGGSVRYTTRRRMQRKLALLEQQHAIEKERARIAQDMHDDLGARLTQIAFLCGTAERRTDAGPETRADVKKIIETSREVVQNLDAIVWAVEPRNDSLESLADYLQSYTMRYLNSASIPCLFDAPADLPQMEISPEARHNVFLVLKEALNNIVKHSGATEVRAALNIADAHLELTVGDNGKGFSISAEASSGNGLHNMRARVEKIGGCFEQSSQSGKGTRLHLRIPLQKMRR